jgi:K+-transporting ATPase KdpF subunit
MPGQICSIKIFEMDHEIISLLNVSANGLTGSSLNAGYLAGGVLALFILGYLIYTLMKPEKF